MSCGIISSVLYIILSIELLIHGNIYIVGLIVLLVINFLCRQATHRGNLSAKKIKSCSENKFLKQLFIL